MVKRVLIVHRQLAFAVSIKQALERTGNFDVHPFTSVDAALDYLRDHPQDVGVVDFTLGDAEVVSQLRAAQPGLALIATPRQNEQTSEALDLQGSLPMPFSARDAIPLLEKAAKETLSTSDSGGQQRSGLLTRVLPDEDASNPPPTRKAKQRPPDLPEFTSLDRILASVTGTRLRQPPAGEGAPPTRDLASRKDAPPPPPAEDENFEDVLDSLDSEALQAAERQDDDAFDALVQSMRREEPRRPLTSREQPFVELVVSGGMDALRDDVEQPAEPPGGFSSEQLDAIFQRLMEEEPPMPTLEESGTVGDLFANVTDASFQNVLALLRGEATIDEDAAASLAEPEAASEEDLQEAFAAYFSAEAMRQSRRHDEDDDALIREFMNRPPDDEDDEILARTILETAEDASTPLDSFSLDQLLASIESQLPAHRPKVQPLPSWVEEYKARGEDTERLVREPDFLPEVLPDIPEAYRPKPPDALPFELDEFEESDEYADQATLPSRAQRVEAEPEDMETQWLPEPKAPSQPAIRIEDIDFSMYGIPEEDYDDLSSLPPAADAIEEDRGDTLPFDAEQIESVYRQGEPGELLPAVSEADRDFDPSDFDTEFQVMAGYEVDARLEEEPLPEEPEVAVRHIDDPYIAQLAVSLTQASLELTAEATLLTRDDEIVAFAGRMAREEIEELRSIIADQRDSRPEEARIRFVTLRDSGKDYMLYSRRTQNALTLSLIFSGMTPLRDIRRQGKRLVEALRTVPEHSEVPSGAGEIALATTADNTPRTPYTLVWLLRDPNGTLSGSARRAIEAGMRVQLRERAWTVQNLDAQEDYVYLQADIPGDTPPYEIVRDLKRRSAEIAHAQDSRLQPETLWADSYLIVTPGRELEVEEIQQFINFERML